MDKLDAMEGVNHNKRQRRYGAQDKDDLIKMITKLHEDGYSQVEIAKKLDLSRGTILRWNKELQFFQPRTPGEAGKLKNKIYQYDEHYFQEINTAIQAYIVGYILGDGTILDRGKKQGCSDMYFSSAKELRVIFNHLYQHGDIKVNRKFERFSSLMR